MVVVFGGGWVWLLQWWWFVVVAVVVWSESLSPDPIVLSALSFSFLLFLGAVIVCW